MASSSDEVAADFEDSLKDLQTNNRYEISNLTIIAKENTEHAQVISEVLEKHIRTTPPHRKLPALYVLDSIVKNVGSPYPVYLGRNLFSTFMDAYQLVDPATRRNMEGMLKTWKESIPNSGDPAPVFSSEVTKRIENALIKAKTAAVQSQQNQARSSRPSFPLPPRPMPSPGLPYQSTATPPHQNGMYAPPSSNISQSQYGNFVQPANYSNQPPTPVHVPQQYPGQLTPSRQFSQFGAPSSTQGDVDRLLQDIERLIKINQSEFAINPADASLRKRLQALLELQVIVRDQQLPVEQLKAIQDQVSHMSVQAQAYTQPLQQPPQHFQPPQPSQPQSGIGSTFSPLPFQQSQQQYQAPPSQPSLPQGIDMNAIAHILGVNTPSQPPTNSISQSLPFAPPAISTPLNQPPSAAPPAPIPQPGLTGTSVLNALRAAGLVGATPATSTPTLPSALPLPPSSIVQQLSTPPARPAELVKPTTGSANDITLTPASLKIPRPELYIAQLIHARPNQCSTCGRRFTADAPGRAQKQRHLDWHFRTNRRLQDEARRGQHRAFFADELAWIRARELDESADPAAADGGGRGSGAGAANGAVGGGAGGAAGGGGGRGGGDAQGSGLGRDAARDPKTRFIPVPPDAAAARPKCPICQEEWSSVWKDEVQDWVWMDAIKVAGRVYHATCYEEVHRGVGLGAQPMKRETSTPDSVLGKRKGELEGRDGRTKMKKEGV
ncbi:MAG: hypothetical protein M1821_003190 [Bathelium mastoideum]|nr:MAG: hypothetical protein M1821_003190 [Bathelium mastoideum]